jgi:hypothetical protein
LGSGQGSYLPESTRKFFFTDFDCGNGARFFAHHQNFLIGKFHPDVVEHEMMGARITRIERIFSKRGTEIYTHITKKSWDKIKSPLDDLDIWKSANTFASENLNWMNIRLQAAFPCFSPKTQLRKASSFGRLYATVVLSGLPGQFQKQLRQSSQIGWIAATGRVTKRVLPQLGGMVGGDGKP